MTLNLCNLGSSKQVFTKKINKKKSKILKIPIYHRIKLKKRMKRAVKNLRLRSQNSI